MMDQETKKQAKIFLERFERWLAGYNQRTKQSLTVQEAFDRDLELLYHAEVIGGVL